MSNTFRFMSRNVIKQLNNTLDGALTYRQWFTLLYLYTDCKIDLVFKQLNYTSQQPGYDGYPDRLTNSHHRQCIQLMCQYTHITMIDVPSDIIDSDDLVFHNFLHSLMLAIRSKQYILRQLLQPV